MTSNKPNFFIVGSMKSGTSTIHSVISSHPEVFMSEPKEPSFFVNHEDLKRIWPEMAKEKYSYDEVSYLELFRDASRSKVVGESSSNYSKIPHAPGVARRISEFNPDAKILFVLRNPVSRTISHYWHSVKREGETRSILEAIKSDSIYLDVSNYILQINEYLRYFDKENIFVITLEQYSKSPASTIKSIFYWLGIDDRFVPDNLCKRSHETPKTVRRQRKLGFINRVNFKPFYKKIRPILPKFIRLIGQNVIMPKVNREAVEIHEVVDYIKRS
ncbi:MAG: sulfotransferase, partial [Gammaproteobacteria bacterium]|nr:sulfotransferase [Gammaproteobacteria bacterium]